MPALNPLTAYATLATLPAQMTLTFLNRLSQVLPDALRGTAASRPQAPQPETHQPAASAPAAPQPAAPQPAASQPAALLPAAPGPDRSSPGAPATPAHHTPAEIAHPGTFAAQTILAARNPATATQPARSKDK